MAGIAAYSADLAADTAPLPAPGPAPAPAPAPAPSAAPVPVDDELRTLRERLSQLEEMVARLEVDPLISGVARAFKTTTGGSYPTGSGTNKTFLLIPQDVTAATTEGASGTVTAASGTVKGVNVGPGLPANGTEVLGYYTGTAWVFQY